MINLVIQLNKLKLIRFLVLYYQYFNYMTTTIIILKIGNNKYIIRKKIKRFNKAYSFHIIFF